jgi:TRAP-type mannitol/chloroaromatic compound transport system permease small subunit
MEDSRSGAAGIVIVTVAVLALLPFLIVVGFYTFAQIQAIVTGFDLSSETLNVPVLLIGLVGTVALFLLVMAGVVAIIGRSFSPKRRERDEELGFSETSQA